MERLKNQLPGLTGLRFFAALLVIICHIEQFKCWSNIAPSVMVVKDGNPAKIFPGYYPLFGQLAGDGVFFFFNLSGFLITYLLFREERIYGDISIKQFYIRRMLRIWPLYYLMVFIGLILCPILNITLPDYFFKGWEDFWPRLFLFMIMLPQLVLYPSVAATGHLWSIGVEEAFYLMWPPILRATKKYCVLFAVFIIVGTFYAQNYSAVNNFTIHHVKIFQVADKYLRIFCFQYIAIGTVGAWVAVNKPNWCKFLFRPEIQAITYFLVIKHLVYYSDYGKWDALARGIPNLLLIMNVALNPKTWITFENKILKYLGDISYGIYVYHILCIHLMVLMLLWLGKFENQYLNSVFLYATSIPLTIFCAAISHHYFEKLFLAMRERFKPEKIDSLKAEPAGDLAVNTSL